MPSLESAVCSVMRVDGEGGAVASSCNDQRELAWGFEFGNLYEHGQGLARGEAIPNWNMSRCADLCWSLKSQPLLSSYHHQSSWPNLLHVTPLDSKVRTFQLEQGSRRSGMMIALIRHVWSSRNPQTSRPHPDFRPRRRLGEFPQSSNLVFGKASCWPPILTCYGCPYPTSTGLCFH